jgi:hypothetical protein
MAFQKAHVVRMLDVLSGDPASNPDSTEYGKRFLAEGDSWFSFNAVPHSANVLDQLRFDVPSIVFTLSKPGDTIKHMSTIASNPELKKYLQARNFASSWDAIFFSGGGNDLIDAVSDIIVNGNGTDPKNWINTAALGRTLDTIMTGYAAVVAARDAPGSVNAGKRIVVHTYDYPTPRNAAADFLGCPAQGPWFWTRFQTLGVADRGLRSAITDYVLNQLAQTLLGLAARFQNFKVVDTRGVLIRAEPDTTANSNDWLNEIHPNSGGYQKIADQILPALAA